MLPEGFSFHQFIISFCTDETPTKVKTLTLMKTIHTFVPKAQLKQITGNDVEIRLPIQQDDRPLVIELLCHIRENRTQLSIQNFEIGDCGLDNVFMNVNAGKILPLLNFDDF